LKLSPILARYLFQHRRLHLAGIGIFLVEETAILPEESGKNQKGLPQVKIKFEEDVSIKQNDELVAFVAKESGKMKSLAAADLDSHLELARQFLNIGKPFLLEGIGTLSKNKNGRLDFVQGYPVSEKSKEPAQNEVDYTSTTEDSFTDYEEMFSPKKPPKPAVKRIAAWLIGIVSIGLAVWGGYLVYSKTKSPKNNTTNPQNQQQRSDPPKKDTLIQKTQPVADSPVSHAGTFRFVIELANKHRALKRFNDLKSYGLDIKMDTRDSVTFKLYFLLPALPADTARIRDSLIIRYGRKGAGYVEQAVRF